MKRLIHQLIEWFAAQVTGIKTPPELSEAYRHDGTSNHLDPL